MSKKAAKRKRAPAPPPPRAQAVAPRRKAKDPDVPGPDVKVSNPGDKHEKEADAAADRIVKGTPAQVSRAAAPDEKEAEPKDEVKRAAPDEKEAEPKDEVKRAAQPEEEAEPKEEVKRAAPDEKEAEPKDEVKRAAQPEEEAEPKEEVKRAASDEKEAGPGKEEDEEPVRRKAAGPSAMSRAAQRAIASPGPGRPIHGPTRSRVEKGLGSDLSHVRVHDDAAAHSSADDLHARAFTHGNHIWLGRGESDRDLRLMSHESAHVVQQQGPVRRAVVHRNADTHSPPSGTEKKYTSTTGKGEIDTEANPKKVVLPEVDLPPWKKTGPEGLTSTPPGEAKPIPQSGTRDSSQVSKWEKDVRAEISAAMNAKLDGAEIIQEGGKRLHFLAYKGAGGGYLIGTKTQVKDRARRPDWDKQGKPHYFDVDHFQELQVGGADDLPNFWLLDAQANQTSGSAVDREVNRRIGLLLTEAEPYLGPNKPTVAEVRKSYATFIKSFGTGLSGWSGDPQAHWTRGDVKAGKPVEVLDVLSEKQAKDRNLIGPGAETVLTLFTSERGGGSKQYAWDPIAKAPKAPVAGQELWPDFTLDQLTWDGTTGSIKGTGFKNHPRFPEKPIDLPLAPHGALKQAAVVQGRTLEAQIRQLDFKGLSPVEMTYAEMRDGVGIYARGVLRPSLPIFKGAELDIVVEGRHVTFQKTFTADELKLPGPVKVKESSLTLGAGTRGLTVVGEANFEIERLGKGKIGAQGQANLSGASFAVEGEFEFDTKLFDKAKIKAWYRDEQFGGEGKLEIGRGKFKGIESATLDAKIEGERIAAQGNVRVSIKGVDKGTLDFKYDPATGMEIGGSLQLTGDIPGIQGGSLQAKLSKGPEGAWKLAGAISATPSIPGVSGTISGEYDDGAFTVQGTLGYEKGMVKGSVTLGATNRAVDESGRPAGPPTDKYTAFGGGEVAIQIAPWLKGTVGLKLKPNGQIVVSGEVALPSTLDIFPEKKVEKNIFSINLDIPIVGLSVAGQRVGIFATIGGGLDAHAGIGPGQLRNVALRVQYNPDNEADTKVSGNAQLYIPARAGLRLFVRGGLGAGIPLVSATAGLEVGGTLGVEGAAEANVAVDWAPGTGLKLDADLNVHAQPSLTFDVTGFVKVEFDYFFDTATLYEKRWQLAAFKYGSDMRFGIKFPFHYQEGEPFDVSLSDVEFEYPQIEPSALLSGLVKQFA